MLVSVGVILVLSVSGRGACLLALMKCYSRSVKVRFRMLQASANYIRFKSEEGVNLRR